MRFAAKPFRQHKSKSLTTDSSNYPNQSNKDISRFGAWNCHELSFPQSLSFEDWATYKPTRRHCIQSSDKHHMDNHLSMLSSNRLTYQCPDRYKCDVVIESLSARSPTRKETTFLSMNSVTTLETNFDEPQIQNKDDNLHLHSEAVDTNANQESPKPDIQAADEVSVLIMNELRLLKSARQTSTTIKPMLTSASFSGLTELLPRLQSSETLSRQSSCTKAQEPTFSYTKHVNDTNSNVNGISTMLTNGTSHRPATHISTPFQRFLNVQSHSRQTSSIHCSAKSSSSPIHFTRPNLQEQVRLLEEHIRNQNLERSRLRSSSNGRLHQLISPDYPQTLLFSQSTTAFKGL